MCTIDGCIGRLWIYYTDDIRKTDWGTFSTEGGMGQYERDIVCRQLGYQKSNSSENPYPPTSPGDNIPVWFTNVDCGNAPISRARYKNNILQCDHEFCEGCTDYKHKDDVVISCGEL